MNAGELLQEISDYCRKTGLAESTFGRRAVNDGKLTSRLRNGGRITTETLDRIRTFMTTHIDREGARPMIIERSGRPSTPAFVPAAPPVPIADNDDPQRNFRFFDNRLNIGARANRVVPSEQLGLFSTTYRAKPFTTFDIYGSWDFNENASLRFAVNNLTDVAYVDPMNSSDFPAPGRTATLSLKVRF